MLASCIGIVTVLAPAQAVSSQSSAKGDEAPSCIVLKPARVFDGAVKAHDGWVVVVRGSKIEAVGPESEVRGWF